MPENIDEILRRDDARRAEHHLAVQEMLAKPTHRRIAANYIEWTPSHQTTTWRDYVVGFTDEEIVAIDAAIGEA